MGREAKRYADILALDGVVDDARVGGGQRVPRLARHEGDVLADDDLGLLVVEGEQVRRGEDVDVVPSLGRAQHRRQGGNLRPVREGHGSGDPPGDQPGPPEDERVPGREGGEQLVHVPGEVEVGTADHRPVPAGRDAPELRAEVPRLVEGDLHDDRLDVYLAAADVELLDDPQQRLVVVRRRDDDQGVGRLVGCDLHPALELGGDDASARRRYGGPPGDGRRGGARGAGPFLREGGEHLGHFFCVRVFEVVDVDLSAAGGGGDVDLFQQVRHLVLHLLPCVHDHAVGAGIRQELYRDAAGEADLPGAGADSRGGRRGGGAG